MSKDMPAPQRIKRGREIVKTLLIGTKLAGFPEEGIESMDAFYEQACTRHP